MMIVVVRFFLRLKVKDAMPSPGQFDGEQTGFSMFMALPIAGATVGCAALA
jgi:hypothetical protein